MQAGRRQRKLLYNSCYHPVSPLQVNWRKLELVWLCGNCTLPRTTIHTRKISSGLLSVSKESLCFLKIFSKAICFSNFSSLQLTCFSISLFRCIQSAKLQLWLIKGDSVCASLCRRKTTYINRTMEQAAGFTHTEDRWAYHAERQVFPQCLRELSVINFFSLLQAIPIFYTIACICFILGRVESSRHSNIHS